MTPREYRARRWAAARQRIGRTIAWTIVGLVLAVPLFAYAMSPRGPLWATMGGLIAVGFVVGFASLLAWRAAGRQASSQVLAEWATASGWAHWHRDMPAGAAAGPLPEATPLLRLGDRRYETDVVAGTVDGVPVRIANHCFEEDHHNAKGERTTTYTYDLVALLQAPLVITPMRLVRRSAVGRVLRGADDAIAGWGAMRVEDLENDSFRERFSVRVADDADPTAVFAVFDPLVQEQMADGRAVPGIDLVEAEGDWLLLASSGEFDGDELGRVDAMIDAVRWALGTLGRATTA